MLEARKEAQWVDLFTVSGDGTIIQAVVILFLVFRKKVDQIKDEEYSDRDMPKKISKQIEGKTRPKWLNKLLTTVKSRSH